jgi:hypothetical protein
MSDADAIFDIYQRCVRVWAEKRGDRLMEGQWLDRLQALMPEAGRVLDLGCDRASPLPDI